MATTTKTLSFYQLTCDECGRTSPAAYLRCEAVAESRSSGWWHQTEWNGQEYVSRDLCPTCATLAEAEMQLRDYEDEMEYHQLVRVGMG